MKYTNIFTLAALLAAGATTANMAADDFTVTEFAEFGPYPLRLPFMTDSTGIDGKTFDEKNLDKAPSAIRLDRRQPKAGKTADGPAVRMLSFDFSNSLFAKPEAEVTGIADYTLYLDGLKTDGNTLRLTPGEHNLTIRYAAREAANPDSVAVTLKNTGKATFSLASQGAKRGYTLDDVLHGTRITGTSISPDGKYLITNYSTTARGGNTTYTSKIISLADGKTIAEKAGGLAWMPKGARYYFRRPAIEGTEIVAVDAATGAEEVVIPLVSDQAYVTFTPDEQSAILSYWEEGKKEDPAIYQVIEPDDRQPGWRNQVRYSLLDLSTGVRPRSEAAHASRGRYPPGSPYDCRRVWARRRQ